VHADRRVLRDITDRDIKLSAPFGTGGGAVTPFGTGGGAVPATFAAAEPGTPCEQQTNGQVQSSALVKEFRRRRHELE
jgi:hypothetical protein